METMFTIRRRDPADIASCIALLHAVHAQGPYPRISISYEAFLTDPAITHAWVAERSNTGELLGHVTLAAPSESDLALQIWRRHQEQTSADCASGNVSSGGRGLAMLKRLFVAPSARGLGVGAALIRTAVELSDCEEGSVRLALHNMETDVAAKKLYERLGWEAMGDAVHEWKVDDIVKRERVVCYFSPLRA